MKKTLVTMLFLSVSSMLIATQSLQTDTLAIVSASDSLPWQTRLQQRLAAMESEPIYNTSQIGVMIWDLKDDSCLYAHNDKQTMRPASTMKLLTAITALDQLGTDYMYRTRLYIDDDNIYVEGGMDPTFDVKQMNQMVDALVEQHIDTIRGSIVCDNSFKDADRLGEGWCWDDDNPVLAPLLYKRQDHFGEVLRGYLDMKGIVVLGNDSVGSVPTNARLVRTVSTSIEPIMMRMLKESDNLYAESMLYQLAARYGGKARDAQTREKKVMAKASLDASLYRLADGSGLSLYNYLSAEAEVKLLRYAFSNDNIFPMLYQSLPVGGVDGTLSKRMTEPEVKGRIHAKTGTLSGVSSLAGYVQRPDGHLLAFCIICQGCMKASNAKALQDSICRAMVGI